MRTISRDFVVKELSKVTRVRTGRNSLMMLCPFHADKDPSMSVSLGGKASPGVFNCFGCGQSGSWNTLAAKLGLTQVGDSTVEVDDDLTPSPKIEVFSPMAEEDLILEKLDEKWRGFSPKFLRQFEVKKLWEPELKDYYVYLPVSHFGEYMGHIRGKISRESPGFKYWFNLKDRMFYPYDYYLNRDTSVMILVEGVTDAYRLIKHGMAAIASLGTRFPMERGKDYLEELSVEKLIICFDGDKEGKKAAKEIASYMDDYFDVRLFIPPKGRDPGDMPMLYINALRSLYRRLGGVPPNAKAA